MYTMFFNVFGLKYLTWNNNTNNTNKRRRKKRERETDRREREKEKNREGKKTKEREDFADADLYSKTLIAHARSNKPTCAFDTF